MKKRTKPTVESTKVLLEKNFFKLRVEALKHADGRLQPHYYTFDFADWANVVALTPNQELILIRQYRHSSMDFQLEVPGGVIDMKDGESPLEAAKRELQEETGYESDDFQSLGFFYPNPSLQSNRVHTFLALNCEPTSQVKFDAFEDIDLELYPLNQLSKLISSGDINHSIVVASLFKAHLHLSQRA